MRTGMNTNWSFGVSSNSESCPAGSTVYIYPTMSLLFHLQSWNEQQSPVMYSQKKITEALGPPQIQIWDACVEVPVWAAWVDHNKPEEAPLCSSDLRKQKNLR